MSGVFLDNDEQIELFDDDLTDGIDDNDSFVHVFVLRLLLVLLLRLLLAEEDAATNVAAPAAATTAAAANSV